MALGLIGFCNDWMGGGIGYGMDFGFQSLLRSLVLPLWGRSISGAAAFA
jgi:hypothetical protein